MNKYHVPLQPNGIYHIFNRAIGNEKLFKNEENYLYFLKKMAEYVLPIAEIYTYSLMPNHFHIVLRIKSNDEIEGYFLQKKKTPFNYKEDNLSVFIMNQFSNWLNGYTKAFNKMYNRKGGLFIDFLKRSEVNKDSDFTSFIFYVHKNAVHHKLCNKIGEWRFDGYNSILSEKPSLLNRKDLIEWFGTKELFVKFHQQPILSKIDFIEE